MKNDERLSGALQENILTLLCFDEANCKMVRASLTPQLFESSVFREVAGHAIDFIDQYGSPIGEHLPDHLESILKGDDSRKAATYERLLANLFQAKDSINSEYIISQLHRFVRQQTLKDAVIKAVEAIESGQIELAETELQKGLTNQAVAFEPGTNLGSPDDIMGILDHPEEEGFNLGIPELDHLGIYPRRKELFAFMASRGKGKSWFITHCLKQAALQRWSALVVTLEMSESRYAVRVIQSFFSISQRAAEVKVTRLVKHGDTITDMVQEALARPSLQDDDIRQFLAKKVKRDYGRRPPIRIKSFPTGSLDLNGLEAYLDGLERFEGFTPDLICIDYPKLMKLDPKNLRVELGALCEGIRGIGQKRNASMVIVTQGNRESESAQLVVGDMTAEDISILATSDNFLTYSQTIAEQKLGLARIFTEKVRNSEAKMQVLITQAYGVGQFCLDSAMIRSDYWDFMEERQKADKGRSIRRRRSEDDE